MMSGETTITRVLMDVDTGVDDAMALAMAVASPAINLIGVTTVAGNVSLEQATANTLRVLDHVGADDVPVFRGMSRPLSRDHFDAAHFHGRDGLGGAPIPVSYRSPESMTAPEFIVQSAREHSGDLTLVFVGPLSNLAVALSLEPDLPQLVSGVVIMGGAFSVSGNATPFAEFNIAVDPEAAQIVADSDLDVTWLGLDVTHSANLYLPEWEQIGDNAASSATLVREVCRYSFTERADTEMHLHDPLAIGVVLMPDLVECERGPVLVDTSVRSSAGMTRIAGGGVHGNGRVAVSVRSEAFRRLFGELLGVPIQNAAMTES
jgi:purine nucleosidase